MTEKELLKHRLHLFHARMIGQLYSKDPRTKVGALAIGDDGEPRGWGYNGQPRGCSDGDTSRHEYPTKGFVFAHAEENLVANASRTGVTLKGATVYVDKLPCCACGRMLINSGVKRLVTVASETDPRWIESTEWALTMFKEANVEVIMIDEKETHDLNPWKGTALEQAFEDLKRGIPPGPILETPEILRLLYPMTFQRRLHSLVDTLVNCVFFWVK